MTLIKKPTFEDYMEQRVFRKNQNLMILVVGNTGFGKSYTCLSKAESYYKKVFDKPLPIENCCFTPLEFMERINSGLLKRGDVLILEEVGISQGSRNWYSNTNKLINYLLQSFRNLNLIVFLNTPDPTFLDAQTRKLLHFIWECVAIDPNKKICRVKPLQLQINKRSGKVYLKYLRVVVGGDVMPLTRLNVPLPSEELRIQYEVKKKSFTQELNKQILNELREENKPEQEDDDKKELTILQENVLKGLKEGLLIGEVAKELGISSNMVYSHLEACKRKGYKVRAVKGDMNKVIKYEVVGL